MEIWKEIEGFNGIYKVSNCGRVKTVGRYVTHVDGDIQSIRERILFGSLTTMGYHRVTLQTEEGKKDYAVHRLVAKAFIPNPNNKPEVNHIDGDPLNNFVDNLEWVTHQENMQHAISTGLKKMKKVAQYDRKGNFIRTHDSVAEASRFIGKPEFHTNIRKVCIGERSQCAGYVWRYVEKV